MRLEVITRQPEGTPRPTPLLFVHGAWHGAWCWDEHFLPYFAEQGYTVHALSLRGHGESEGRERLRWTRLRDYVADVKQVADSLPVPPVLIGHSMGGFVVQKYLERYSARAGVLLASLPSIGMLPFTLRLLAHHPLVFFQVNTTLNPFPILSTASRVREFLFTATTPNDLVERTHGRVQNEAYGVILDMMLSLPRPQRVKAPIMVIGATEDGIFPVSEVLLTARTYRTTALLVENAGHNLMLEPSWQTTADHILSWLADQDI